jgi:hypothetical protein
MMLLAASKAAKPNLPRKHETEGTIATCKRRANYLNPKETRDWPPNYAGCSF